MFFQHCPYTCGPNWSTWTSGHGSYKYLWLVACVLVVDCIQQLNTLTGTAFKILNLALLVWDIIILRVFFQHSTYTRVLGRLAMEVVSTKYLWLAACVLVVDYVQQLNTLTRTAFKILNLALLRHVCIQMS